MSCCARSFVQLSAWPDGDRGYITALRQAQLAALRLNRTGMAVSADRSDPSGMWHPVHPPWKQDIAARLLMEAQRLGVQQPPNASHALRRPELTGVTKDEWNPGWRDYHFGYGSVGGICSQKPAPCFGLRLTFDAPLEIVGASAAERWRGAPSGFELGDSTGTQWQPLSLIGLRDANRTVQLNATFAPFQAPTNGSAPPTPARLRYAWHDYPTMVLYSAASGRPVAPFSVAI